MIGKGVAVAGLLAAAAIGLAACSSNGPKSESGSPANSGPATSGRSATTGSDSSAADPTTTGAGGDAKAGALTSLPKDACALVPHDQVASATGQQIAAAPIMNTTNATATLCIWADPSDDNELSIKIEPHTADWKDRFMKAGLAHSTAVTDLGVPAYGVNPDEAKGIADAQLTADAGCCLVFVDSGFPQVTFTQLIPIAKAALAR